MGFGWLRNFKLGNKVCGGDDSSDQPLAQIANLLPGVYYRMEFIPEFHLTLLSERVFGLLGYKAKELLNKNSLTYHRLINPEHEEIVFQKKTLCQQGRGVKRLQYHLVTKSRSVKFVEDYFIGEYNSTGQLIAINGYLKEKRESSVKLQLHNQLEAYRAAIDVNIISSITDTNGVIIFANDNFKKISQFTDEELLGKSHRIIRSGHHPKSFFEGMWKTISTGKMWRGEILNCAKDGSLYWVDTVIIPVFNERKKINSYLSLRMLITERKQAEEQREKYVRVLEEIADVVAHDVRGPICRILGLVNLIEKSGFKEQDLKPSINYLLNAANELDEITRGLSAKIYAMDEEEKSGLSNNEKQNETAQH
jgi:PAS domain S-box-containing protein